MGYEQGWESPCEPDPALAAAASAKILAALPLRLRPGLAAEPVPGRPGEAVIVERSGDPEDAGVILGLAVHDSGDNWLLACVGCREEIDEADAGMCQPCREECARRDSEAVAW
jgi:hypothetical protein